MTYDEIKKQFEDKLAEVRGAIREVEQKVSDAQTTYHDAMGADVLDGDKATAKALTFARTAWDYARQELAELLKRADVLESMRAKKLAESFPALVAENRATIQLARAEYETAATELMRNRAEILLKLQALSKIEQQARAVHSQTEVAAREAGVDYRDRFSMPNLCLTNQYSGVDANLIPTSDEVTEALKLGKVPKFVELYGLTGEVVSEREATHRLRIMKEDKK